MKFKLKTANFRIVPLIFFSLILLSVKFMRQSDSQIEDTLELNNSNKRNLISSYEAEACGLNPDSFILISNSDKDSGESEIAEMKSNFRDSDLTLRLLKSGKLSKMDMNDPDT